MTNIVKVANLSDVLDYKIYSKIGTIYPFLLFSIMCASGMFNDTDGTADLCYKNQIILNMSLSVNNACITISDKDDFSKKQTFSIQKFYDEFIFLDEDNFSIIWYENNLTLPPNLRIDLN